MSTPLPSLESLPPTPFTPCDEVWPPSTHDVALLRCLLPRGHRSAEHWTGPLWRGHAGIVWLQQVACDVDT